MKHIPLFSLIVIFLCGSFTSLMALSPGDTVHPAEIRDANNRPMMIPSLGEKPVLIFYPDPDVPNQNKDFADAMKKTNFPPERFAGMGIVNLKDAPFIPDSLIRFMIRREIKADKRAVIYTDPDRLLQKAWGLGDCNNKFVIILIDKNMKVLFIKKGDLTREEIDRVIGLIREMVK